MIDSPAYSDIRDHLPPADVPIECLIRGERMDYVERCVFDGLNIQGRVAAGEVRGWRVIEHG